MPPRTRMLCWLTVLAGVGTGVNGCDRASAAPSVGDAGEAPWLSPVVPSLGGVETAELSAASCGECHPEAYAEWTVSTHAHAWTDAQFQAERLKDPKVGWLCLNCHTPLSNQQEVLYEWTGDVRNPLERPNPAFDPGLQSEGVTCLSCHWREDGIAVSREGVDAPHATVYTPSLRTETTCTGCHQAEARLDDVLVCAFNTGAEWAEAAPGKTCPECHMPEVIQTSPSGERTRVGHRHTFPGSRIPKTASSKDDEERMSADWRAGVDLELSPFTVEGGRGQVTATVLNRRAGHMVPTGDPERYLELTVTASDLRGTEVARSVSRIGQVWEWWPKARKLSDNRLAPGAAHHLTLDLGTQDVDLIVTARLDHVRISPENVKYHGLQEYPDRRTVERVEVRVNNVAVPDRSAP